jgi:hypothetical protein
MFHLEPGALHSGDRVAVEVTAARQPPPDGGKPVLQSGGEPVRRPNMLQQTYRAPRVDGAAHLGERRVGMRDSTQRETDDGVVERAISERKRLGVGSREEHGRARRGCAGACPRQHPDVHIDPYDRDARLVVAEVQAGADTDFEHPSAGRSHDGSTPAGDRAGFGRAHHRVVEPGEEAEP